VCKLGGWRGGFVAVLICVATAVASHAQTFTSLVSLDGSNGNFPETIVQGTNGELWGTIANGGKSNCGNLLKMSTAGVLKTEEYRNQHWYASLRRKTNLETAVSFLLRLCRLGLSRVELAPA
jgi:hypothetical protein